MAILLNSDRVCDSIEGMKGRGISDKTAKNWTNVISAEKWDFTHRLQAFARECANWKI
jgi:hypothetical protein